MSEDERRKRFRYRKKRNRIILFQVAILILTLLTTLVTGIVAYAKDNSYYVNYSEKSTVDYGVILKDNDFYEESFLGKDYAYIASLIDKVQADFGYNLKMDSQEPINFTYSYRIDAVVQIKNKASGKVIFAPVYNEVAEQTNSCTDNAVKINGFTLIDYAKYNDIANRFIKAYKLDGATAELSLQMHVNVTGMSEEFLNDESNNSYVSSISIPLSTNTVEVKITSAIPKEEQKILSYTTEDLSRALTRVCIAFAIASAILVAVLWIYAYLSRNIDITYDIKVQKLVRSYKSFIQKLINSFNTDGYQILLIGSFEEMLEIRDTIQSPILMEENGDRTMTKFFIPTNTKLLYVFEIKVDNYDEIYGVSGDTPHDEPAFEEVVEEPAFEAIIEEPATEEVSVVSSILDNIVETESDSNKSEDADGETVLAYFDGEGNTVKITCARSFTANLIQSNPQIKEYYNEIKNYILSFKGIKARTSWRYETYKKGRIQLFKMKIRGKMICLYCALDPNDYDSSKYFHKVTESKAFSNVPMLVRIKSDRGLKRAKTLVNDVMAKFFILPNDKAESVDYVKDYPYDTTKNLVERKLIKLLLPDAVAAEPKPHHHVHRKTVEMVHEDVVEQIVVFDTDKVDDALIEEIALEPTPELEKIDYDDASEEIGDFVETEDHPGVDVIGVVWPERPTRNKIYRYDPDGEIVSVGDIVIVPTRDSSRQREVIRKAVVAHANHKVAPEDLKYPLKKIAGVIRTKRNENADMIAK